MYLPPPVLSNPTSPSSISNPPSYLRGPWYWISIDHGTGQLGVVCPRFGIGCLSNWSESKIIFFVELASLQDVRTPISTTTCFSWRDVCFSALACSLRPSPIKLKWTCLGTREREYHFFLRLTCAHMLIIKIVCLFQFPSKF